MSFGRGREVTRKYVNSIRKRLETVDPTRFDGIRNRRAESDLNRKIVNFTSLFYVFTGHLFRPAGSIAIYHPQAQRPYDFHRYLPEAKPGDRQSTHRGTNLFWTLSRYHHRTERKLLSFLPGRLWIRVGCLDKRAVWE